MFGSFGEQRWGSVSAYEYGRRNWTTPNCQKGALGLTATKRVTQVRHAFLLPVYKSLYKSLLHQLVYPEPYN